MDGHTEGMSSYTLTRIVLYPVKSFSGLGVPKWEMDECGLKYDRRWIVINESGKFQSQRQFPEMSLFGATIEGKYLRLNHATEPVNFLDIPLDLVPDQEMELSVWKKKCQALIYDHRVNDWISGHLGASLKLAMLKPGSFRTSDGDGETRNHRIAFSDGFPFHITGWSSLDALNERLGFEVSMNRFRPNFVFSGGEPFEEDSWNEIRIGKHTFFAVQACDRCILVNVDQQTGQAMNQPLGVLSEFRKSEGKIYFGQNLSGPVSGWIETGSSIEVISKKTPVMSH